MLCGAFFMWNQAIFSNHVFCVEVGFFASNQCYDKECSMHSPACIAQAGWKLIHISLDSYPTDVIWWQKLIWSFQIMSCHLLDVCWKIIRLDDNWTRDEPVLTVTDVSVDLSWCYNLAIAPWWPCAGLILGLRPDNERRHYRVTASLIG